MSSVFQVIVPKLSVSDDPKNDHSYALEPCPSVTEETSELFIEIVTDPIEPPIGFSHICSETEAEFKLTELRTGEGQNNKEETLNTHEEDNLPNYCKIAYEVDSLNQRNGDRFFDMDQTSNATSIFQANNELMSPAEITCNMRNVCQDNEKSMSKLFEVDSATVCQSKYNSLSNANETANVPIVCQDDEESMSKPDETSNSPNVCQIGEEVRLIADEIGNATNSSQVQEEGVSKLDSTSAMKVSYHDARCMSKVVEIGNVEKAIKKIQRRKGSDGKKSKTKRKLKRKLIEPSLEISVITPLPYNCLELLPHLCGKQFLRAQDLQTHMR